MTREEEIKQAAANERSVSEERAFVRGAQWADIHEDQDLGVEPMSLEECIKAATPAWQGVDVDAFLDEVRGREPEDRWISVEDALPEKTGFYNVVLNGSVYSLWYYPSINEWAEIYADKEGYLQNRKMEGVTHWQRLPVPPKKEGTKGNDVKISPNHIIGTEEHIKVALDVLEKGGEK